MIIKVENKSQTLVRVTNLLDEQMGLILVPENVSLSEVEEALEKTNFEDFIENNTMGVQKVYPYEMIVDVEYRKYEY